MEKKNTEINGVFLGEKRFLTIFIFPKSSTYELTNPQAWEEDWVPSVTFLSTGSKEINIGNGGEDK